MINIDSSQELFFLDQQDIWKIILSNGDSLKGQRMGDIQVEQLRSRLMMNPFVKTAEVYTTFMGEVNIEITQRRPIVRVITKRQQHVYLDDEGLLMPVSRKFAVRVPIVRGYLGIDTIFQRVLLEKKAEKQQVYQRKTMLPSVYQMASLIDTSAFWKAQMSEIQVNRKHEFELLPLFGNHVVVFGSIDNMVEKFDKLFLFYHYELNNFGFNKYKLVNLKYQNQIVCTKNKI